MCIQRPAGALCARRLLTSLGVFFCLVAIASQQPASAQGIVQKIEAASDRVELSVNTSKILTLEHKIPRAQVDNPDLVTLTPLSPNQIQVAAKKPGVTQINLWDENGDVYGLDVIIYGDAKELEMALKTLYPESAIQVLRFSNSLVLSGFVDSPEYVSQITRLAEDYSPKVVNKMSVAGVHQILLNVQVMEVSRTKLRRLGFDFAALNESDFVASSISGLLSSIDGGTVTSSGGENIAFGVVDGSKAFFGFLEALRSNNIAKVLAEPRLTTVSGRPASFHVGGEIAILVAQGGLGGVDTQFEPFGTQIDFVPLVLGNGNIRLEVRPRVREVDDSLGAFLDGTQVPGFRTREVDTAVEMKAGQTLALAGLIQSRTEASSRSVPFLGELPWIGAAFRRVEEEINEVELLILVRPEFVDALDPHEVPPGGPGLDTTSPSDHDLFFRGHIEVPRCCLDGSCPHCQGAAHGLPPAGYGPGPVLPGEPLPPSVAPEAPPAEQSSRRQSIPRGRLGYTSPRPDAPVVIAPDQSTTAGQQPVYVPARTNPHSPASRPADRQAVAQPASSEAPGLIGPVGYDLEK
ncbi:MAG: pilus assembly protein N-terminal domain-containing protein [Pirellulales bacterium]